MSCSSPRTHQQFQPLGLRTRPPTEHNHRSSATREIRSPRSQRLKISSMSEPSGDALTGPATVDGSWKEGLHLRGRACATTKCRRETRSGRIWGRSRAKRLRTPVRGNPWEHGNCPTWTQNSKRLYGTCRSRKIETNAGWEVEEQERAVKDGAQGGVPFHGGETFREQRVDGQFLLPYKSNGD